MKVEQRINRIASERIRFSYNLAAVLVLIMHCSGNLPVRDNWSYSACKIIAEAGMIGVPWFLFMSAYFLFRNYEGDYKNLLRKKYKTLLIPYIAWNGVGYFFRLLVRNPINHIQESFSFKEFLKAFVPFKNADGPLWFMVLLIFYVLLTPLIKRMISNKNSIFVIILVMVTFVALNMMSANYWSAIFYAPMYLLGGYVALHFGMQFEGYISENIGRPFDIETHNTNNVEKITRRVSGMVVCFGIILAYHKSFISQNIYLYLAPVMFIVLMKIKMCPCKNNWFFRNGSFIVYASHTLFTNIFCLNIYIFKVWSISFLGRMQNIIPAYFSVVMLCLLTVGTILILAWLFRNSKWIRIFTGGRN